MIVKHSVFYELIICLHAAIKPYRIKIPLFVVVRAYIPVTVYPLLARGSCRDNKARFSVFRQSGFYGVTSLFYLPQLKYVFVLGMCLFPLFINAMT